MKFLYLVQEFHGKTINFDLNPINLFKADQINLATDRLIEGKRIEWRNSKLSIPM